MICRILVIVMSLGQLALAEFPEPPQARDCNGFLKFLDAAEKFHPLANRASDLAKQFVVLDPEKQLRPGDILVYPFDQSHADPNHPPEPEAYKSALGGYGHAAIVAKTEDGRLYHLDSPMLAPGEEFEFGGPRKFYVLRPETPPGMSRAEFEQRINKTTEHFFRNGFDYDPLMNMDFKDPDKLAALKKQVDLDETKKLPPMFCSELTQTILAVAGAKTAEPTTFGDVLDLATERMNLDGKKLTGKELDEAVDTSVKDVIAMFVSGIDEAIAQMTELKKVKEQMLRKATGEDRKILQFEVQGLGAEIERVKGEKTKFGFAKVGLKNLLKTRIEGKTDNGWKQAMAKPLFERPIVRPFDILADGMQKSGEHRNFTLTGIYPGHLKACVPTFTPGPEVAGEAEPSKASPTH